MPQNNSYGNNWSKFPLFCNGPTEVFGQILKLLYWFRFLLQDKYSRNMYALIFNEHNDLYLPDHLRSVKCFISNIIYVQDGNGKLDYQEFVKMLTDCDWLSVTNILISVGQIFWYHLGKYFDITISWANILIMVWQIVWTSVRQIFRYSNIFQCWQGYKYPQSSFLILQTFINVLFITQNILWSVQKMFSNKDAKLVLKL